MTRTCHEQQRGLPTPSPRLGLNYIVTTPVDRDDLRDGGAAHFAAWIRTVRRRSSGTSIEVQTRDFRGRVEVAMEILCTDALDLQPRPGNLPVRRYLPPRQFEAIAAPAPTMGLAHAACSPPVRSSYRGDRRALATGV